MGIEQIRQLLLAIAYAIILIAAILAVSWLLSYLTPGLIVVFQGAKERLQRLRVSLWTWTTGWTRAHVATVWGHLSEEPVRPLVVRLAEVAGEVGSAGLPQLERVETVEEKLREDLRTISNLSAAIQDKGAAASPDAAGSPSVVGAFVRSLFLLALTLLLILANAFMLVEFFRAVFPNRPLLPYPLPEFSVAHALAALMVLCEFAAGALIHSRRREIKGRTIVRILSHAPEGMIAAFALIELFAYAVLSVNVNMPARLGIDTTSAFYGIARYFMAFFGPALTIGISALGYSLWESVADFWTELRRARERRSHRSHLSLAEQAAHQISKAQKNLEELRGAAAVYREELAAWYAASVGTGEENRRIALAMQTRAEQLLGSETSGAGRTRGANQALAGLALELAVMVLWLGVSSTLFFLLARSAFPLFRGGGVAGPLVAGGITLGVGICGFLAKEALFGSTSTAPVHQSVDGRAQRRWFGRVAIMIIVLAGLVSTWIFAQGQVIGRSWLVNAGLALFLVFSTALLAFQLDQGLVALVRVARLSIVGAAALVIGLVVTQIVLAEGLLAIAAFVLELVSVPGRWLRSLHQPPEQQPETA